MFVDYRRDSVASLSDTISNFKAKSKLSDQVLDGLLAVSVWHSIKDGQVTPAIKLLDACSACIKDRVSMYLTKYGNIRYSAKEGMTSNKEKNKVRYGLEKANAVFATLPSLAEAFPSKAKEWKDFDVDKGFQALLRQMKATKEHGRSIIASAEAETIIKLIQEHLAGSAEIVIEVEESPAVDPTTEEIRSLLRLAA